MKTVIEYIEYIKNNHKYITSIIIIYYCKYLKTGIKRVDITRYILLEQVDAPLF